MSVYNYLLKPPKVSELRDSLLFLCRRIEQRRYEHRRAQLEDLLFQRSAVNTALLDPDRRSVRLIVFGIGAFTFGPASEAPDCTRWNCSALLEALRSDGLPVEQLWVMDGFDPFTKQLVFFSDSCDTVVPALVQSLYRFSEPLAPAATLLISRPAQDLQELPVLSRQCAELLRRNLRFGTRQLLKQQELESRPCAELPSAAEREILRGLARSHNTEAFVHEYSLECSKAARCGSSEQQQLNIARFAVSEICRQLSGGTDAALETELLHQLDRIAVEAESAEIFGIRAAALLRSVCEQRPGRELSVADVVGLLEDEIRRNYCSDIDLDAFSKRCGYHPGYLVSQFSHLCGVAPRQMIIRLRMEKAVELLKNQGLPIKDVALMTGYNDVAYFSRAFKEYTGSSPSAFQNRQETTPPGKC